MLLAVGLMLGLAWTLTWRSNLDPTMFFPAPLSMKRTSYTLPPIPFDCSNNLPSASFGSVPAVEITDFQT